MVVNNQPLLRRPRIIALLQGLASHGGIQRHSRTLCRVLTEYACTHHATVEILSFTDPDPWYDDRYVNRPVQGCAGNRRRFVTQALRMMATPYDMVIVGQIDFGPIVLLPHMLRPNVPVVAFTYGIEVWHPLPIHKRLGLRIVDRILSISEYTASHVVALQGVNQHTIDIVPCTMDPDFLAAATAWQSSGQQSVPTRLLTISRMHAHDGDKGIDMVIKVLPHIVADVPDVNYTIIGDGEDRIRLEQLAHAYGVADIVHFVGRVPDDQLHAYLSGTDIFVLPSRKEGFGIVFLEAMLYAKPIIAGAHGGSPEVVIDGQTGILVEHGDQPALAAAIVNLLQDAQRRRTLGEAGYQRLQQVFQYTQFQAKIEQTFDDLLGASRTVAGERY
jgi:glycosyltransferase involved in cell wall biosynthesis